MDDRLSATTLGWYSVAMRSDLRAIVVSCALAASGCCFGGSSIPLNPAQPEGYVSGPLYAHCITQTTPFNRCTEVPNTGPVSGLGGHPDPQSVPTSLAECQLQRPVLGECPLEDAVGACISGRGRRLYVDYRAGTNPMSWSTLERQCTAERPTAHYVRVSGSGPTE